MILNDEMINNFKKSDLSTWLSQSNSQIDSKRLFSLHYQSFIFDQRLHEQSHDSANDLLLYPVAEFSFEYFYQIIGNFFGSFPRFLFRYTIFESKHKVVNLVRTIAF